VASGGFGFFRGVAQQKRLKQVPVHRLKVESTYDYESPVRVQDFRKHGFIWYNIYVEPTYNDPEMTEALGTSTVSAE
jgi:hypothetical protein